MGEKALRAGEPVRSGLRSRMVRFGVADRALTPRECWATFWSMFFFCTMTMYNCVRVTPVLTGVGAAFGMTLADAGLIVSVFAIAGLLLAFPGAWLMRVFGIKSTLLVAAAVAMAGTVGGLFASSPAALLASRALEGVAFGVASVVVPNVLPRLFPAEKRGLVSGIWSLWVTPGLVLGFVSSPLLFEAFGHRSLWVVALLLEVLCAAWLALAVKVPAADLAAAPRGAVSSTTPRASRKSAFAIALSMFCWGMVYGAVNAFYPTYLQEVKGVSLFASSMVPLALALVTAPFGIAFGVVAGRTRTRTWFLVIPYAAVAVLYATIGFAENASLVDPWVFAVLFGVCAGGIPMATYALVPILARDARAADYSMATLAFSLQLANIVVGFYGLAIQAFGYSRAALLILVPLAALGAIVALLSTSDRKALEGVEE